MIIFEKNDVRLSLILPDVLRVEKGSRTDLPTQIVQHRDFGPIPHTLEESGSTVLCLDYKQNGIGSNSCGPELIEKYRLTDETIDFSIRLIPETK